jgi:CTP synthase
MKVGEEPGVDVTIVEIGGTVGDIESIPYLEAARQFIHDLGKDRVLFIHLTLVPEVGSGEFKTKPTQHSVKALREIGIQPDILLCRATEALSDDLRYKISLFTNVEADSVVSAYDVKTTIYEIPMHFAAQGLDERVVRKLGITCNAHNLSRWSQVVNTYIDSKKTVNIGIVGKYLNLHDSYKSVFEALIHGGIANRTRIELVKLDSEKLEITEKLPDALKDIDGFLVPGGFGQRGIEGMVGAVQYARTHRIPCFGICLGMQVMVIEYARNVLGLAEANSTEFAPNGKHPVISLLEEQIYIKLYGGTMRLGRSETRLAAGTRVREMYGTDTIAERHRHRYEVSNQYRKDLAAAGLVIGGLTPDGELVESVEWPDHPWGIGVQFHPEFKSKPIDPHPLFSGFVAQCLVYSGKKGK